MLVFDLINQQCEEFNLADIDNYFVIGFFPFNAHNFREEVSFKNIILSNLKGNRLKSVKLNLRS